MVSGRLFSCRAVPVGSRGEMWQNIRAVVTVGAVYTIGKAADFEQSAKEAKYTREQILEMRQEKVKKRGFYSWNICRRYRM